MIIPVVLGVATLTFFLMKLTPGDPVLFTLGDKATPEAIENLRHAWGLDRPVAVQYVDFLRGLVTGDLGESYKYKVPVMSLIAERLVPTIQLMILSLLFAVVISVPLALWVAVSRSKVAAAVVRLITATIQGLPTFFIGALLIAFVALRTGLFPVGGYGRGFASQIHTLTLPALAVALTNITPILTRSLIASLKGSLDSEFVGFATSKGLSRRRVLSDYALRNGSISGISILGIQAGSLIGGALVVENVFAIPGVGSLLMDSVLSRDYTVVQALTVVFGVLVVLSYLVTDLVYGLVDPRARATGRG